MRLRSLGSLSLLDEQALEGLTQTVASVPDQHELMSEGECPDVLKVLLEGLACRYKILPDGRRQIVSFLVPGDVCDLEARSGRPLDHGVATLAPCIVATVDWEGLEAVLSAHPTIAEAFRTATLADVAILREWLVNVGRRDAYERMAHLLWELFLRHAVVGRVQDNVIDLPLTQMEIADALGLSTVYVNKTVNRLRSSGVVAMDRRQLRVLAMEELRSIAGFDASYLRLPPDIAARYEPALMSDARPRIGPI